MSTYVMGLDFGSSGGRCLLLDLHGGAVVSASRAWRFAPAPGAAGLGFDLDLELHWRRLADASREAMQRAGIGPDDVVGVAATALRLGNVMLAEDGEPLLAVPNRDARAVVAGLTLAAQHGDALYRVTGRWPYPIYTAARLQWLASERPADFERVSHVLSISDWIAWRLCGERVSDATQAGETLLFDLAERSWADEWIAKLGLPREILPPVLEPGTRLGALGAKAAEDLGLRSGTAVAVGAADTQAALLGAGALAAGEVVAVAGSTGPIQLVVDRPLIDGEARLWSGQHVLPGRWLLESNCGPLGESLDWLARLLFPEAPEPTLRLLAEAASSTPGALGLLSSFGAEVMNARQMALPVGHLTLTHLASQHEARPRRHLARSVVEGMACALRANLEQIESVAGSAHEALLLTGGLSQSESFTRVVAGVLGKPVRRTRHAGASALGAALCAAVGAGIFDDLEAAAAALVESQPPCEPASEAAEAHAALYQRWSSLRAARAEADRVASQLTMPFAIAANRPSAAATGERFRPRVLVTADFDEASLAALRELAEVEYAPFREAKRMLTGPALVKAVAGFDVFISEIDLVDAACLEELPELRVVASCRGDAVNVDVAACTAFGIPVLNAPGRNADAVADLALGFFIMLSRRFPAAGEFLRQPGILAGDMGAMGRAFGALQGRELWRKTIGLVGLGAVGRKVAERLQGFGARLLVADPFVDAEQAALHGAELVELPELLERSDFVSLHAAVSDATVGLIGAGELARMKPDAFLVNTARAALVDEEALIAALESGRLAGAALDTFSVEPPGSDHPFMAMQNVISTPHVGGNTVDVSSHQGEIMLGDLRRLLAGERPLHVLDPAALEGFSWRGQRRAPDAALLERLKAGPPPAVTDLQKQKKKPKDSGRRQPSVQSAAAPEPLVVSMPATVPAEIRQQLTAIIESFMQRVAADDSVRAFAADKDVTLHFALTDVDLSCHLHLGPGDELRAALGPPAQSADVQLRMRAATFDGMFNGTANPMEAAMDGRLSFTGDAAKAMTLQQMQADLERLYKEARAEVGDPGDLASLPDPAGAAAPAGSEDLREQIVAIVRELYEAQVITATGGNVSARLGTSDEIWITPSRLFKGDLSPGVMVRIDLEGRSLDPGSRSPSSEWDMHCAIYRARPEVRAVVHAHAPRATTLANTSLPFAPISTEAAFFGEIARVPFIMPGTRELAEAVSQAMAKDWAALMVNHGLIVAGRSLRSAADMVEIIERSAELILGCHAVGKQPPTLPDDVVEMLREMGDLIA